MCLTLSVCACLCLCVCLCVSMRVCVFVCVFVCELLLSLRADYTGNNIFRFKIFEIPPPRLYRNCAIIKTMQ